MKSRFKINEKGQIFFSSQECKNSKPTLYSSSLKLFIYLLAVIAELALSIAFLARRLISPNQIILNHLMRKSRGGTQPIEILQNIQKPIRIQIREYGPIRGLLTTIQRILF